MDKSNGFTNNGFTGSTENGLKPVKENNDEKVISNTTDAVKDERPTWSNGIEFLMSCIATSVGLGNIWRFPFIAYENGGGAFLIPYIIVLFLIGRPLYYLEMAIGQFSSQSCVKIWEVSPFFKGVGVSQVCAVTAVVTYYCSLMAITLHYLFSSFASELPWGKCREEWGPNCVDATFRPDQALNLTNSISSSELYFLKEVLKEKSDISDGIGAPDWKLSLYLALAWLCVFVIIVKGIKSTGKASYFLALFPYVVMIAILIRAVTLDGAVDGILFFIKPQWGELLNPKVWYAATTQLFFSLSVGMAAIIMFSSYNRFDHNVYRDALIVTTLDTFTSLLNGFTMFAILGNLAHTLHIDDISNVVKSGTGLAFISYPDVIAKLEWVPQLFAVLFFFMLFVLGIGSVVAMATAIVTTICDSFPRFKFWQVAIFVSVSGCLIGLIYVTPGGQWMLNLVDHFGTTFLVFAIAIVEVIAIIWIYGLENFSMDLEFMSSRRVGLFWRICWSIITPGLMILIFIYYMIDLKPISYGGLEYPDSALVAGWLLFSFGLSQLPLWAIYAVRSNYKPPIVQAILKAIKPSALWGPKIKQNKDEWISYKTDAKQHRRDVSAANNHSRLKQRLFILFGKYHR